MGSRDFTQFEEIFQQRHQYAQQWKARTGAKVLGYLCTYVPEEIISAAGLLPVRLFGSHEPQDITEPYVFSNWCPYSRDSLAQGLLGRYPYLDGLVHAHSCQHIIQTYDSWVKHIPLGYHYEIYVPAHLQSPAAASCLEAEMASFQSSLEAWRGRPISASDLARAIEVFNTNRRLMRQTYELRKGDFPPITGAEAMAMVLASQVMDKEEHNRLLQELLRGLPKKGEQDGVRLMLLGSETDDLELVRFIESLGAIVVTDEHCTGSRYFWNEVPAPYSLSSLAQRYVERPPCPHKDLIARKRFEHVFNLAREYKVQGAVFIQQKFCDVFWYDIPPLQALLQKEGIPSLILELDVTTPVGQFRTRIEAFLETMLLEVG